MPKRNLVMGVLSSYPLYYIKPFFTSLKNSGYTGDTVIFVNGIDNLTKAFLESMDIVIIPYFNTWPYFDSSSQLTVSFLTQQQFSPNSLRYILYHTFLSANHNKYDLILMSDVRDVYFQKDPFDFNYNSGLSIFMESNAASIGTQTNNNYWIENGFGKTVLHQLFHKPISCSGVTIGTLPDINDYLNKMIGHITTIPNIPGLDQGIHNYLLHTGSLTNSTVYLDDEGPVSTLSQFKPKCDVKIKKGNVVGVHNQVINIVHQYDRSNYLLIRWNFRYFLHHKYNQLKGRLYFLKIFLKKNIS